MPGLLSPEPDLLQLLGCTEYNKGMLTASPNHALQCPAKTKSITQEEPMKPVKVASIGCGTIANSAHGPAYAQ